MHIPLSSLSSTSRVWTFLADRILTDIEQQQFLSSAETFLDTWAAHNIALNAGAEIRFGMLVIIAVDENIAGASGCSLDKLHQFIKLQEQAFTISFLDRMRVGYCTNDGEWNNVSLSEFLQLIKSGVVNEHTDTVNALCESLEQVRSSITLPATKTWLKRYFTSVKA
jgi:hypothetical protein